MTSHAPPRSRRKQPPGKAAGLAREVLKNCPATKNDIFFCLSTSGVNAVPVETAEIIHSRGIPTVAICSSAYFDQNARSASGKHLYEVSDLWIDNKAPHGDAWSAAAGCRH